VRVVAGSNPATPTNLKSFIFRRFSPRRLGKPSLLSGDCAQFRALPAPSPKRAGNFSAPLQRRNGLPPGLDADMCVPTRRPVADVSSRLADGLDGHVWIFRRPGYCGAQAPFPPRSIFGRTSRSGSNRKTIGFRIRGRSGRSPERASNGSFRDSCIIAFSADVGGGTAAG
jgi:hypothetical protein